MKNKNKILFTMAFAAISFFVGSVKAEENACVENSRIGFEKCAPVVDDKGQILKYIVIAPVYKIAEKYNFQIETGVHNEKAIEVCKALGLRDAVKEEFEKRNLSFLLSDSYYTGEKTENKNGAVSLNEGVPTIKESDWGDYVFTTVECVP